MSNNFVVNEEYAQPYVHATWTQYKKYYSKANVEGMYSEAFDIYKQQSERLKRTFGQINKMEYEEADKALKTVESALNALINNPAFLQETDTNLFLESQYHVDGSSFYGYSTSAKKREQLFQDDTGKLMEFITKFGEAIDAFDGVSEETKRLIESQTIEQQVTIPTKDMAEAMKTIYDDGKADKGLKKLVAANLLLKKYAGMLPAEQAKQIPNISDADAKEIIRGLAGSINGLKGGFFEIAVNALLNNTGSQFMKDLKSMGLEVISSQMQGDTNIKIDNLGGKAVTSKTDLQVQAVVNGFHAELGLSLKTAKAKEDKKTGKLNRHTIVHTGNLGHLIMRANALMSDSTYHLANTAAHRSYQDKVYKAARAKMAAMLAFDALAGLGVKPDVSYFIMYQDKIVNIADFLDQLSRPDTDGTPVLGMTIQGTGEYAAKVKKLRRGEPEVERYVRSKEAMRLFLGLKVVLTSKANS